MRSYLCAFLLAILQRRFTSYRCAYKILLIVFAQGRVPLSRFLHFINNVCAYARLSVARVLLNSVNYNCARIHISIAHFWTYLLLRILDLSVFRAFWTFQLLRILVLKISFAQSRLYLLCIVSSIMHPSLIDHSISFLRVLFMLHLSFIDQGVYYFFAHSYY